MRVSPRLMPRSESWTTTESAVPGVCQSLRLLAEAADGAQGFELGQVALLDAVDLGEVEERLVGEIGVRGVLEDGEEDPAGLLVAGPGGGEHAAEEIGADRDRGDRALGEVGEDLRGLVVDLLGHVGLADAEARVDRLRVGPCRG